MVGVLVLVGLVIWQGRESLYVGDGEWDMGAAIPTVRWEGIVQGRDRGRKGRVRCEWGSVVVVVVVVEGEVVGSKRNICMCNLLIKTKNKKNCACWKVAKSDLVIMWMF